MKPAHLALVALLAACTDGSTRLQVTEQLAAGQISYVQPALAQARRDFLGGATDPTDILGDDVPRFSGGSGGTVAVAVVRTDRLGSNGVLQAKIYLEHGQVRATLPDGLDVLTDPMRVDIVANGWGAEVTAGRQTAFPQGQRIAYSAGLGLSQVTAKVHLQSALIDLRSLSVQSQPYIVLSGYFWPLSGPVVSGEIRYFDARSTELRLGLVQAF